MTSWLFDRQASGANHLLAYRFEGGILTEASKGRRAIPARQSRAGRATQPLAAAVGKSTWWLLASADRVEPAPGSALDPRAA
jgi:hypothetical protein